MPVVFARKAVLSEGSRADGPLLTPEDTSLELHPDSLGFRATFRIAPAGI